MTRPVLVVANKNYSSWSMRAWVLLAELGIAFDEVQVKLGDGFAERIARWSPSGKVPVLWIDGEPVWDSLAIAETVAELHPERGVWPADAAARRLARSVCAEMHSGFGALRGAMPMNIRGFHPGCGATSTGSSRSGRTAARGTGRAATCSSGRSARPMPSSRPS